MPIFAALKMANHSAYEIVVGLEVHAQLLTRSKLFCSDSTAFGSEPNSQISPITLAHPGTLPKINKRAIEFAIKMGLACNSEIEKQNYFARKNYFYPDLPKGYQISQHTTPICKGGFVKINLAGQEKTIRLNRIHLEEDAGKSLHDVDPEYTCIDYNRAGIPLIEIVSEPDISSGEEAFAYLTELRKLVRYLEICDGNMEEGSLRCDANVSARKKGDIKLGTRVEIKNLNSIRNVKRAIDYEAGQIMDILEDGGSIIQQTKSFDANKGTTATIRYKEDADDYRYFAEPDLTPFYLNDELIENIRKDIPALQDERIKKYTSEYKLSGYDAAVLTDERSFADYFERIILAFDSFSPSPSVAIALTKVMPQITRRSEGQERSSGGRHKAAANWMLGPVKSWLNENNKEISGFPVHPEKIAALIQLIENGTVNFSIAATRIFPLLIRAPEKNPGEILTEQNLTQQTDSAAIESIIDQVLSKLPEKVKEYKKGKKGLMGLFVGEVMKLSKGKADPGLTNKLLLEKLKL